MDIHNIDPTILKFMERVEGSYDLTFKCRTCGEKMSVYNVEELLPGIDEHHKKSPKCLYLRIF